MRISIAFATNKKYEKYAKALVSSILGNTQKYSNIDIYIFSKKTEKINRHYFKNLVFRYPGVKIIFKTINDNLIDKYPVKNHISSEAYIRILMPDILNHVDKLVYLDSDVIVNAPIENLYKTDLKDKLLAAVSDRGFEVQTNRRGLFNSGVLVINSKKYRSEKYSSKILRYAYQENIYGHWYADQDILNYVLRDNWLKLNSSWNVMTYDISNSLWSYKSTPKIIHFTGGKYCKPDHILCDNPYKTKYFYYAKNIVYIPVYISRKIKSILDILKLL